MSEHTIIDICVKPIELCKLLKIAKMVVGGEAKTMISEGHVLVNNEVTIQKRKKISPGDIIECNGKIIEVAYNPTKKSAEFISTVVSASKNSKKKKRAKSKARVISSETVTEPSLKRSKRKPISR
ncbi:MULTISPECIES: RNA-binding S4 domain-containing protein [unclassified Colwellia]|uniref:RNA-binding S4 domain-containing protein n=1 Tax=unclassified Colwellia TaxID=196834 RepID=UPI0015F4932D|nr:MULTISPECIES: RNA-binding S4 domain-containing protein [unclassified Colwellia]MBA6233564.1 RNA-binding S4 domain-containing protein [Colwellia sp. MB02u-7]MBA6238124.1 RNA-binding S4 domain-containing protein [Colwellia sp. MB02u-11]MBA6257353.1 RNA-binding S4 domain-containing protein [Colwellia sp. MB3u-28]MBA6258937.1 RNA-binding S4 domain-containing protein [Colwellia sp. MB3u-41]MBA6299739.1 RNA-binding S4 domain-containing protein [Colwellia sp. MB3u-22]